MKAIIALAATVAALASASTASASENAAGHWEWRSQSAPGPRSNVPSRVRVWVNDDGTRMAQCDCAMMKADAAGCMKDMHGMNRAQSAG